MILNPAHHVLLAVAHGATAVASIVCVLPRARTGDVAPSWLGWSKLVSTIIILLSLYLFNYTWLLSKGIHINYISDPLCCYRYQN